MPRGPRWGRVGGHAPRPPPPGRPRPSPPRRRGRPRTAHAQKQTPSPPHAGARSEAARGAGTRKRRKRLGPRSAAAFNGRAGPGQRPAPRRCVRPPRRGCGGRGAGGRVRPFYVPLGRAGRGGTRGGDGTDTTLAAAPMRGAGPGRPLCPRAGCRRGPSAGPRLRGGPAGVGTKAPSAGRAEGGGSPEPGRGLDI